MQENPLTSIENARTPPVSVEAASLALSTHVPFEFSPWNAASGLAGHYVMLRPLSRGIYTLSFGGILPRMSQAVTYTLRVE